MTGFGDGSEQVEGIHYAVEVRSLNNRYFKATLRLPEDIQGLEAELESLLRKKLWRGSITLTVKMRISSEAASEHASVNQPLLLKYVEELKSVRNKLTSDAGSATIDLAQLLALPGVLQQSEECDLVATARPVVLRLAQQACDKLLAMRVSEGKAIADDLAKHRDGIRESMTIVQERAPLVIEEYHTRLRSRIDDLLARAELNVGQVDLIREVGVFAERADISEEISRMLGHLDQFTEVIDGPDDEPAGRKLEFIGQEMLREANTMGSKSNDAAISRAIVEVKGLIDRIKEQAQNVE